MARPLRIEYAGALYHVTARGDRRENFFSGPQGRNNGLPRIAPDDLEQRAESKEQKPLFSSPSPNPALKGTRGYALVFSPYPVRPRPLARALGI